MKILLGFSLAVHLSFAGVGIAQDSCEPTVIGDLRIEHFQSKIFERTITVRVWLPPNYNDPTEATKKFPTLYMLDGQNAFDQCTAFKGEQELRIDETVTPLIADHTIGPMIVVGIDSAHGEGRDYEYEAWKDPLTDGNQEEPDGKHLPSFFGSELVPFVSARYRVSDDTAHIGIGGTSVGLLLPYMSLSTVLICSGWCWPKARTFGWAMGNCCAIRLYFCERQIESQ